MYIEYFATANSRHWVIINKHEIDDLLSLGLKQNDTESLMAFYTCMFVYTVHALRSTEHAELNK